jgi:two-component system KDP operon response regulator KdpE
MSAAILIVEDNLNIRRFIRTTLQLEGYRVSEAGSLRDSLASAQIETPDLVVLDLALPDGSGWEFLSAMQARPETRRVPILVLTASADPGMADRVRAAGAAEFLTKPIAAAELVARVRAALDTLPQE